MLTLPYSESRRFTAIVRGDMNTDAASVNVTLERLYITVTGRHFIINAIAHFSAGFTETYTDTLEQTDAWLYWIHNGGRDKFKRWLGKHGIVNDMQMVVIRKWGGK